MARFLDPRRDDGAGELRLSLVEEARQLAADESDREEMQVVREQLADLAPAQQQ